MSSEPLNLLKPNILYGGASSWVRVNAKRKRRRKKKGGEGGLPSSRSRTQAKYDSNISSELIMLSQPNVVLRSR